MVPSPGVFVRNMYFDFRYKRSDMKKILISMAAVLFSMFITTGIAFSGDLDDGIGKFTDDSISKYDEMGKADKNIKFIVMNAKSQAAVRRGSKDGAADSAGGDANMNSVVLGAGSKVKGDIYIIDQSRGPKTNIAD